MSDITHGNVRDYFETEGDKYQKAWGAFTMGIVVKDTFDADIPLHHQIHIGKDDKIEGLNSGSIFVSLSHPDDGCSIAKRLSYHKCINPYRS